MVSGNPVAVPKDYAPVSKDSAAVSKNFAAIPENSTAVSEDSAAVPLSDAHTPPAIGEFLDVDAHGILREDGLHHLGPLDKAGGAGVEVIVSTDVPGLAEALDAVKVEVVDGTAEFRGIILVDDGEGGAVHHIAHPEFLAQRLHEGGFPRAHRAVEGEDAVHVDGGKESLRRSSNVIQS